MQRVEDHRTASLPRQRGEAPQQLLGRRPLGSGERFEQVARRCRRRASRCSSAAGRATAPADVRPVRSPWLPSGYRRRRSSRTFSRWTSRSRIQRCYKLVESSVTQRTARSIKRAQAAGFGSGTSSASSTPRPTSAAQRKTTSESMSASGSSELGPLKLPVDRAPLVELRGLEVTQPLLDVVIDPGGGGTLHDEGAQRGTRPVTLRLRRQRLRQPPLLAPLWGLEVGGELFVHRRDEQVGLVAEVAVDRAAAELGPAREIAHRHRPVSVLDEEVARRPDQRRTRRARLVGPGSALSLARGPRHGGVMLTTTTLLQRRLRCDSPDRQEPARGCRAVRAEHGGGDDARRSIAVEPTGLDLVGRGVQDGVERRDQPVGREIVTELAGVAQRGRRSRAPALPGPPNAPRAPSSRAVPSRPRPGGFLTGP